MKIKIIAGPSHQSMWYSKKDYGKEFKVLKTGVETYYDYHRGKECMEGIYWVRANDGYLNWIWFNDAEIIE